MFNAKSNMRRLLLNALIQPYMIIPSQRGALIFLEKWIPI